MKDYLERMFRFVAWADQRSLGAVRATPASHEEALPLMAHVLAAEHVWLSRLRGREPSVPVWPKLSVDECDRLAKENYASYRAFLAQLGDGQLSELVHYRNSQGQEFATPVLDIMTQVITHGPYHRGQIAKIIARAGGTSVNTDFITFAREAGANA